GNESWLTFGPTWWTPRRPKVNHDSFPSKIGQCNGFSVQCFQFKIGCQVTDFKTLRYFLFAFFRIFTCRRIIGLDHKVINRPSEHADEDYNNHRSLPVHLKYHLLLS